MTLEPEVFAQDNARNEGINEIVGTFVPTEVFWGLFCKRHQVILGCRGSGKTAVMKMISFPYLSRYQHSRAASISTSLEYVGVHMSTDIRFVGALKNKLWRNEEQEERYFVWKFNVNCLKAILVTLPPLLDLLFGQTAKRFRVEQGICIELGKRALNVDYIQTISDLVRMLEDYEDAKRIVLSQQYRRSDEASEIDALSIELCDPIRWCSRLLQAATTRMASANWIICIDEAEYLTPVHFRVINSFMRTHTENIFLKVATMPYHHHCDTNLGTPISPAEDFDYVHIDWNREESVDRDGVQIIELANAIFKSRQLRSAENRTPLSLKQVLGDSVLEGPFPLPKNINDALKIVNQHCDEETYLRAQLLSGNREKFGNEIWRKIAGLAKLRENVDAAQGMRSVDVYCGAEIIGRCTDGIPRRMINLFHHIAQITSQERAKRIARSRIAPNSAAARAPGLERLSPRRQTVLMKDFAERRFMQSQTVPKVGPELTQFIDGAGRYFSHKIHGEKLSSEVVGSFRADEHTSDELWALVKAGVAYGFVFSNISATERVRAPDRSGSFRLSYSLSPKYNLMPRRGKDRAIQAILRASRRNEIDAPRQGRFNFLGNDEQ